MLCRVPFATAPLLPIVVEKLTPLCLHERGHRRARLHWEDNIAKQTPGKILEMIAHPRLPHARTAPTLQSPFIPPFSPFKIIKGVSGGERFAPKLSKTHPFS